MVKAANKISLVFVGLLVFAGQSFAVKYEKRPFHGRLPVDVDSLKPHQARRKAACRIQAYFAGFILELVTFAQGNLQRRSFPYQGDRHDCLRSKIQEEFGKYWNDKIAAFFVECFPGREAELLQHVQGFDLERIRVLPADLFAGAIVEADEEHCFEPGIPHANKMHKKLGRLLYERATGRSWEEANTDFDFA